MKRRVILGMIGVFMLTDVIVKGQEVSEGMASYYASFFEGKLTASGERFSNQKLTAAHKTLPFGTKVKITNCNNGERVIVVVNDRLPANSTRIIDVSQSAARRLKMIRSGICPVYIEILP